MYATQAALVERYGTPELIALTDKQIPRTGAIVTAVVTRALAAADAEIDARLALRYTVPLSTTPPFVEDIACRIARYKLHEDKASPKIEKDYEHAIGALRDIAAGRADLPGFDPPATTDGEGSNIGALSVRAPEPVFTAALIGTMP